MSRERNSPDLPTTPFAWDGVSFHVPADWNLAIYKFPKHLTRLEFDDDYTVRLEIEWTRPRKRLDMSRLQKRYDTATRKLTLTAERTLPVRKLPDGWVGNLYHLPKGQKLVTAMFLSPGSELFVTVIVHFSPEDPEDPRAVIQQLAATFGIQKGPRRSWTLYDISLDLPVEFRLLHTRFETGLKLLVFWWERRRLYVWFLNLANLILKNCPPEEYTARLLNSSRLFRSLIFRPGENGEVRQIRRWRHRLGHIDEITRWCFQYRVNSIHDHARNQFIVWVFNHRNEKDISRLREILANGIPLTGPEERPSPPADPPVQE